MKQSNKVMTHIRMATGITALMTLAACGGGGGSSGGSSTAMTPTPSGCSSPSSIDQCGNAQTTAGGRAAAGATPNEVSVTQSSNRDGTGVTEDEVEVTVTGSGSNLVIQIDNQNNGGDFNVIRSTDSGVQTLRSNTLTGVNSGQTYQERLYSNADGDVLVDVFVAQGLSGNVDYLAGGVWMTVPDNIVDTEIGAFFDGPDNDLTPSSYLTTTATASYSGDATGIYVGAQGDDDFVGEFVGALSLNANFGTSPTIDGRISNIQEIDPTRTILTDVNGGAANPTLTLGTANIANRAGGFFTGDVSANGVMLGSPLGARNFTGKWGGQFYGPNGEWVGGTFGGATPTGGDYELHFIGAFGAEKE